MPGRVLRPVGQAGISGLHEVLHCGNTDRGGSMFTVLAGLSSATAAHVDEKRSVVWFAQADGALGSVGVDGSGATVHQTLPVGVRGLAGRDGVLVAALADGTVVTVDPDDPTGPATTLTRTVAAFDQAAVTTADPGTAALVSHPRLRRRPGPVPRRPTAADLSLVSLADGSVSTVPLSGLRGVAVDGSTVYVAYNSGLLARGAVAQLTGSVVRDLTAALPTVGHLGLHEAGAVLLVSHPAARRLSAVRPSDGSVTTVSTTAASGTLVEAHGLPDGRVLVLTSDVLAVVDRVTDLSRDPVISPIDQPIFVGSWTRLSFDLGDTGLTAEDVHLEVPDGLDAGFVSATRVDGEGDPVPLLVTGGAVGQHKVVLVETATATELASTVFEITDHWSDDEVGPSGFYVTDSSFDGASGWGGGPGAPQNLGVHPHTGTWRSMVLMVDTSSGRWPTAPVDLGASRTAILQHVVDGFSFNGQTRSARRYYEENSRYVPAAGGSPARGLTLTARNGQAFGPVSLPGAWTDYFAQKVDGAGTVLDARWSSKGGTLQTIISRSISDGVCTTADYTDLDVLIVVPFSPDATTAGDRFVWPHAQDAQEFLCGTNALMDRRSFAKAYGPLDFDVHDGRQLHATLSHEIGHTLNLPDLYSQPGYSADVNARVTSGWDMMGGSRNALPHYTVSNKMRMGWIPADQLKLYNFSGSSAVTQETTLYASELGDPPAGTVKAIEIRLADGWNYYVEYRSEQTGDISDDLVTDRQVVITDVTSDTFSAPLSRPPILFVRNDVDGDGPLIGAGADYEERDPGTQMDLKVEVVSSDDDTAVVRVSYGSNGRPDPGIRPWTGGPNWQSPDIEVRNDKATADPEHYFNVPWLGHANTVVATVRNSGDLLAKGVVVDFFVTEFSAGDGPFIPLGSDTHDVAPGAAQDFTVEWVPPADRHFCIIVRIRLYQDPGNPAVVETNIFNNEARTNYTRFVSASASPSSRVGSTVLIANPYDEPSQVFAQVKKTHPLHRVFVDHQWLQVDGHDARPIKVWDESFWGTPEWSLVSDEPPFGESPGRHKLLWAVPNQVSVAGWVRRPFESDCGSLTPTGGAGLRVDAARATEIVVRGVQRTFVSGVVRFRDTSGPVTVGGTMLVEVVAEPGKSFTVTRDLDPSGSFAIEFPDEFGGDLGWIELHYLGAISAAPATSGRLTP